jgi:hypothetical protein
MALITRQGKGSKLTSAEMDGNLEYLESMGRPYKVYTALLTQSGTDDPVATVLENTLGGEVVWSRGDDGYYEAQSNDLFTTEKTFCFISKTTNISDNLMIYADGINQCALEIEDSSGNSIDGALMNTPIEIRVYP